MMRSSASRRAQLFGVLKGRWQVAQYGFTLVELMITIAILAILLVVVMPSYSDITLGSKLRSQANDLAAGGLLARSEAIKRNQTVTLCASSDGSTCSGTWTDGWVVRSAAAGVIQAHGAAPYGFLIDAPVTSVDFLASGVSATAVTLAICRQTPSPGAQERVVTIWASGRATLKRTAAAVCLP